MTSTRPHSLAEWLSYIEQQHPATIDMGLERVRAVATAMGLGQPAPHTIVVGGTNGKGST
ncbi:MAG TPA: bifunctional folylpolyglutamate synthase/dihydrofolate synthase, partial [Stenotrophomonas sp.]|nr:bifunctional folylpolyglutamate synthase/dihydrofolate synthase [Stenotrophomonas sp.]